MYESFEGAVNLPFHPRVFSQSSVVHHFIHINFPEKFSICNCELPYWLKIAALCMTSSLLSFDVVQREEKNWTIHNLKWNETKKNLID